MNAPRFRKMVDIGLTASEIGVTLERYLFQHRITYKTARHAEFVRYFVHENDLCCAQAVIPALKSMATSGEDVRA